MAFLCLAGVSDGGRAYGSGPARGQAEQKQPGDQRDVGDVEDAGVQWADTEDDEIDYRTAMKQAVDQVAQAPAGDQRKGDALQQAQVARAQDIDQRAGAGRSAPRLRKSPEFSAYCSVRTLLRRKSGGCAANASLATPLAA